MTDSNVDVAIVGAGTAGLSAVAEVRKRTQSFVLIDRAPHGTTCARVGCMPSKALIHAANLFHHRRQFAELGIRGAEHLSVDGHAVMKHVRELRDHFVGFALKSIAELEDRFLEGEAHFEAPGVLRVAGRTIIAKSIILATGSAPVVPEPWRSLGGSLLTTDELFELEALPKSLGVVGMGAIGAEMAQAFSRLGVDVTAADKTRGLAGLGDPVTVESAFAIFEKEFPVWAGESATLEAHHFGVELRSGSRTKVVDKILVALGRRPSLGSLELKNAGVKLDDHGMPKVSPDTLQVENLPLFVAGDADGRLAILHEAADDGRIAGFNAVARKVESFRRKTKLAIAFCEPNIVAVGTGYDDLPGGALKGTAHFEDQGRAKIMGENRGALRLYADPKDGRLLGGEMVAPRGEHLGHQLAWLIERGATVEDALTLPFYHPTLGEALRTALKEIRK